MAKLLAKSPDQRPASAHEVEAALAKFCRAGAPAPHTSSIPTAVPSSMVGLGQQAHPAAGHAPMLVAVPDQQHSETAPVPDSMDEWGVNPSAFDQAHSEAQAAPTRKRTMTDSERRRGKSLMILGGILHCTAMLMLVLWIAGVFDNIGGSSDPEDTKPATKKDGGNKPPKKKAAS